MKKKMFVMGAYGCGNRGDDAILQSICGLFPDWEICAANGRYCDVAEFLPVRTVSCRLNEGFSLSVLLSMVKDSFVMLAEIAKADALVFGGGSLIHDLTPYNLPFLFLWHTWAKLLRKKVFYFSMGVGPLTTAPGRAFCRKVLRTADGLYVRDQRGLDLCRQLGLDNAEMTADAAFAVTEKNQCGQETLRHLNVKEKEYFCVTASQWFTSSNFWKKDSMDFTEEIRNFAQCIRAAAERLGQPVVFVPTVMHDCSLGEQLKGILTDLDFRIAPADWNCMEMAEIIENASFLLGVRMHSIIFAARQRVPFLALVYDEKVRQLLRCLNMEQNAVSLETVRPEDIHVMLPKILEAEEEIRAELAENCKALGAKVVRSKDKMISAH